MALPLHYSPRMDVFAHAALFACIVASGLGGVAITLVAFRYGLVPPEPDEPVSRIRRRLFATQLAHAVAAVGFSITALSAAAVMVTKSGVTTGDHRTAISERLNNVESLVQEMTDTLDRIERKEPGRIVR